ncbi:MAG: diguanylate cyclase [Bacillota bacterium]
MVFSRCLKTLLRPFGFFKQPISSNGKMFIDGLKLRAQEGKLISGLTKRLTQTSYWKWNGDTKRLSFSNNTYEILHIQKESFHGDIDTFIKDRIHPDDWEAAYDIITNCGKDAVNHVTVRIVRSEGEEGWIQIFGCIADETSKVGVLQEITQWKASEIVLKRRTEFLEKILNTIPHPVYYRDINGIYRYCNKGFSSYVGIAGEKVIGKTLYDVFEKELAEKYEQTDLEIIAGRCSKTFELPAKYWDGAPHFVSSTKILTFDRQGEVSGLVGIVNDITEQKRTEMQIRSLLRLKEAMLELSHAIMGVKNIQDLFDIILEKVTIAIEKTDLACVLVLDDEENLRIIASKGYDREAGKDFCIKLRESFMWSKTRGNIEKTVVINDLKKDFPEKWDTILDNNKEIEVHSSMSAPIFVEGKLFGLINVDSEHNHIFDETDVMLMENVRNQIAIAISKHKLYEETVYLTRYDKLTNVYNRRYFEEVLCKRIAEALRYDTEFSFVMFDLNGLKAVNDTYGHLAGDELIRAFVQALSRQIRTTDMLARFGGDEFVGVFLEADEKDLIEKFEKLAEEFRCHPIIFGKNKIVCSYSYGIADFPRDGTTYDELVKIADERMYEYKRRIKSKEI